MREINRKVFLAFTTVALLGFAWMTTVCRAEQDLISAGDFENYAGQDLKNLLAGVDSLGLRLDPWYDLKAWSLVDDPALCHGGEQCLHLKVDKADPKAEYIVGAYLSKVPVKPVSLSIAAKGNGSLRITLHYYQYEGPQRTPAWKGNCGMHEITATPEWKISTMDFSAVPAGMDKAAFTIQVKPGSNGGIDMFLDDISATETNPQEKTGN
ncbi:MAG: hypothetical protein V2A65_06905 [Candidatus Omnitrophota bacterium]